MSSEPDHLCLEGMGISLTEQGKPVYYCIDCGKRPNEIFLDDDGEMSYCCTCCLPKINEEWTRTRRRRTNQHFNRTKNLTRLLPIMELQYIPRPSISTLDLPEDEKKGAAVIFTDGACKNNGQPNARAGCGVFFGPGSPLNVSTPLQPNEQQTSQRAELQAAIHAIEKARNVFSEDPYVHRIVIVSDSKYLVLAMTSWIHSWKKNGWKDQNGKHVVNKRKFQKLDRLITGIQNDYGFLVQFCHVDREDNQGADELAKAACGLERRT